VTPDRDAQDPGVNLAMGYRRTLSERHVERPKKRSSFNCPVEHQQQT
jgi:hypothetical protein